MPSAKPMLIALPLITPSIYLCMYSQTCLRPWYSYSLSYPPKPTTLTGCVFKLSLNGHICIFQARQRWNSLRIRRGLLKILRSLLRIHQDFLMDSLGDPNSKDRKGFLEILQSVPYGFSRASWRILRDPPYICVLHILPAVTYVIHICHLLVLLVLTFVFM